MTTRDGRLVTFAALMVLVIACGHARRPSQPEGGAAQPRRPHEISAESALSVPGVRLALAQAFAGGFARYRTEQPARPGSAVTYHGQLIAAVVRVQHYAAGAGLSCAPYDVRTESLATGMARIALNPESLVVFIAPTLASPRADSVSSFSAMAAFTTRDPDSDSTLAAALGPWPQGTVKRPLAYLALGGMILPIYQVDSTLSPDGSPPGAPRARRERVCR